MADLQVTQPKRVCKIEGCEKKHVAKGLCRMHYGREYVYGDANTLTTRDRNNIRFDGETCFIELRDSKLNRVAEAIIDVEDYEKCKPLKWCFRFDGYVRSASLNQKSIYLHRFILNPPAGLDVDHKDMNTLDNRKSNLRVCTRSQNKLNNPGRGSNSGYKCVHYRENKNRYDAHISLNGRHKHIGSYPDAISAAKAYNEMAIKHHGEFARLNNV